MQSIILIGDEKFNINTISNIKFKGAIKSYFTNKSRYVVEYKNSHIFFDIGYETDYDYSIVNDYDDYELEKLPFQNYKFIIMSYRNIEDLKALKEFFNLSNKKITLFVDDDKGSIVDLKTYMCNNLLI